MGITWNKKDIVSRYTVGDVIAFEYYGAIVKSRIVSMRFFSPRSHTRKSWFYTVDLYEDQVHKYHEVCETVLIHGI